MSRLAILAAWTGDRYRRRFRDRRGLEQYQDVAAQRLLAHVLPRSAFYRAHFDGHDPRDWRALPTIDKRTMMQNLSTLNTVGVDAAEAMRVAVAAENSRDFRAELNGVTVGLSSGTSGSRGIFLVSPRERAAWVGVVLSRVFPQHLLGIRQVRVAFFLRANSNLYESVGSSRIAFSFFDLVRPLEDQLERLEALAPTMLVAPPSVLRAIAEAGVRIHPERVVSVAEVLDPLDEAVIARSFGGPIHQVYQATEGLLGMTCDHGTLHLAEDLVAIQREPAGDGRFYPIVTDLRRRAQPIVRYRLDDLLVERDEPCPCGSVCTALARVEGRADDCFEVEVAGERRTLFPDVVRHAIVSACSTLTAFGVRQVAADRVELHVAVADGADGTKAYEDAARGIETAWRRMGARPPSVARLDAWTPVGPTKRKRVECVFRAPPRRDEARVP